MSIKDMAPSELYHLAYMSGFGDNQLFDLDELEDRDDVDFDRLIEEYNEGCEQADIDAADHYNFYSNKE